MGNHNSGRRPQPTNLTVLRGNPSRKKLNKNEPVPPAGETAKPEGLSAGVSAIWDELAPICLAMKTLTLADLKAFRTFCELQSTLEMAFAHKDGRTLVDLHPDGENELRMIVVIDAALKLERDTAQAIRPYYEYFGLTPASRARISVPKPKDEPVAKWAGQLK